MAGNKLPDASLEYIRKLRDVKYHETLFELLAKQYEVARLDEAKQAPVIQVVDRAVTPDKSSRMSRSGLLVVWIITSFALSLFIAFMVEYGRKLKAYFEAPGAWPTANTVA